MPYQAHVRQIATKKHTVFHRLLKFAAQSDLASPLAALFQDVTNGPSEIFMVAKAAGWSTFELRELLQWYGIKVWGLFLRDDCITFRVRRAQARYTCHVLLDEQIEFTTTWRGQEPPQPRHEQQPADQPGLLQRLEQWLDTL